MTRSKRLETVSRISANREQSAARVFGEAQQKLTDQEKKLAELLSYRDEYARQFQYAGQSGMEASRMQSYQAFLARLNQAVEEQERLVVNLRMDSETRRQQWTDSRTRTQAIGNAVETFQGQERHAADRQEQLQQDDRSQRRPS